MDTNETPEEISRRHYGQVNKPSATPYQPSSPSFVDSIAETMAQRQSDYAHPADNHEITAELLNAYWRGRQRGNGPGRITEEDVCVFNVLQKISRLAHQTHEDSWRDVVGYAENVSQLTPEQRNYDATR